MSEIKNTFTGGKMNKDLDERLVPNGAYRDANNIQVSTSEGSDAGVVQNLSGNIRHATIDHTGNASYGVSTTATCVASIAAADKDKVYYFVSSSDLNNAAGRPDICKDYILEYNTITEKTKYVFVDIWRVKTKVDGVASGVTVFKVNDDIADSPDNTTNQNRTGIRIGMCVTGGSNNYQVSDNIIVNDIRYSSGWEITTSKSVSFSNNDNIVFLAAPEKKRETEGRVLNFNKNTLITAVNILDDFIYWTDNVTEPKKINIKRSIAGTGGVEYLIGGGVSGYASGSPTNVIFDGDTDYFHTRLVRESSSGSDVLVVVTNSDGNKVVYTKESHITVVKPAPTQPLELDIHRVVPDKLNFAGEAVATSCQLNDFNFYHHGLAGNPSGWTFDNDGISLYDEGDMIYIPQTEGIVQDSPGDFIPVGLPNGGDDGDIPAFSGAAEGVCFEVGDIILFTKNEINTDTPGNFQDYDVRCEVIDSPSNGPDTPSLGTASESPNGYPYKLKVLSIAQNIHTTDTNWYVRLETSEPFFEHKFPRFSYRYKYVDGEYSSFAPFSEIAFLPDRYSYEPKDGYNFGMVNQVRDLTLKYYHYGEESIPQDISEIDILYKETNNPVVFVVKTVKRNDTTPIWPDLNNSDDPFLRGAFKITTDMIHAAVPSNQLLRPYDNVPRQALAQEISANRLIYGNYLQNYNVEKDPTIKLGLSSDRIEEYALPSIKTLRDYQVGVVFSDRYGRETPILTALDVTGKPNSIIVNKPISLFSNRFNISLDSSSFVPDWAEYLTYYVKEASTEYYTMASDRWYDAEDGNIWLSFPSSERNKLTEESFIELKKAHGSSTAVLEPARFKVLAIENEAPDDVRLGRKSLGLLTDNDSIGNAQGWGYPVQGLNFVTIQSEQFNGVFPSIGDITGRTSIVLRDAEGNRSKEYPIVTIIDTDYGSMKITIEDSWGVDMEFAEGNSGLQIEIFEYVMESKPEFSGRFYVKIRKDEIINTYLATNGADSLLLPWGSFNLGYLNPGSINNAPSNNSLDSAPVEIVHVDGFGTNPANSNSSQITYSLNHPTEYVNNYSDGGQTQMTWVNESIMVNYGAPYALCSPNSSDGWWHVVANRCEAGSFFIDAAPAYSWTSAMQSDGSGFGGGPVVGDRPGSDYNQTYEWATISGPWGGTLSGWLTWGDACNDTEGCPDAGSNWAGNMKQGKGQPSRGIWNSGFCMDISWVGFGHGATSFGSNNFDADAPYAHRLQDQSVAEDSTGGWSQTHTDAWYFIQKLTTPGTKFAFNRDPREVTLENLYTTVSFFQADGNVGYGNTDIWKQGTTEQEGAWGIRNRATHGSLQQPDEKQYRGHNMRQRWTITVNKPIGGDTEFGYSPIKGTDPEITTPQASNANFRRALHHDFGFQNDSTYGSDVSLDTITIYERVTLYTADRGHFADNPAVWETVPKENVDLDIYYQASGLIPLELNSRTNEEYIPVRSIITDLDNADSDGNAITYTVKKWSKHNQIQLTSNITTTIAAGSILKVNKRNRYECTVVVSEAASSGQAYITVYGDANTFEAANKLHSQEQILDWNNCWSFGNGVESDRIRDDFNAAQVDNGVKVSSGIGYQVKEERRKHGLIWSGIYNSNAGINDTNQFIMAESITKDLNPVYGSIQRILNRNTRLITFCEDKVLKAVTNRDALYNADGNPQLVASNAVIGDTQAYQGDYGIATNPESMAENPYAIYFTDAMRGKVLRLTTEGIVPISDKGMSDYFADLMKENVWRCLGTFDERKNEYNLTVSKRYTKTQITPHEQKTITYSDKAKGWVSFKDFLPQQGATINNNYYTFYNGQLYKHHDETSVSHYSSSASGSNITLTTVVGLNTGMLVTGVGIVEGSNIESISGNVVTIDNNVTSLFTPQDLTFSTPHNNFYGRDYTSDVTVVFNDQKSSVKSFGLINYEGTQARIDEWDSVSANRLTNLYSTNDGLVSSNIDDEEYYNLDPKNGWYIDNVVTNLQSCGNIFFKNKEGKYYGYPTGESTTLDNLDEKEFSVQGLGNATMAHDSSHYGGEVTVRVTNNTSSTYEGVNAAGALQSGSTDWDSASVITDETSKWECTIGSKTVVGGTDIGADQALTFTLSPVINGVYSGTPVAAENLEWSGATNTSGTTWTNNGSTLGDPTDTLHIDTVAFANTATAGDPNNTVIVTVTFKSSLDWPASDVMWYIDIDEKATHVDDTDSELRDVGFEVHWKHYSTSYLTDVTPDNITTPDITETLVLAGVDSAASGTSWEKWKFIGNDVIESDTPTLVYSDTLTAASNNHFQDIVAIKQGMGVYEDQYEVIVNEIYTNGVVTSFNVKVYYTASSDPSMFPDPADNTIYNLGHTVLLRYSIKPNFSGLTDTITDVTHQPTVGLNGGSVIIRVVGTSGSKYRLNVEEKASTTSDTTIAAGYFNHDTNSFGSTLSAEEFTIPTSGFNLHYVSIPRLKPSAKTVDMRYDVTAIAVGTTSLSSSVPTSPGDSSIIQYGWRSVIVAPLTFSSGSYGALPSNVTQYYPIAHEHSNYHNQTITKIETIGGNGDADKNPIVLTQANSNIKIGMRVISEVYDRDGVDGAGRGAGGAGTTPVITHGTTVTKVDGRYIDLSASHAVPNGSNITFVKDNSLIIPFSFQITPNSNTLAIRNSRDLREYIGWGSSTTVLTGATITNSTTVTLDSIKGIKVGDQLITSAINSDKIVKVTALASGTTVTVDTPVTIADNTSILFKNDNNINLINASKIVSGSNVLIKGHLSVENITENITIPVLVDDIILAY